MTLTRTGLEDGTAFFPGGTSYASSGDNNGSGVTQDWYSHTQTVDARYARINNYDYAVSSPFGSPGVIQNQLRLHYTVQTVDEIIYSASFLGDQVSLQKLELLADVSGGVFGTKGTVNTSSIGLIRRAARKDGNGRIIDTSGTCIKSGIMFLDGAPGSYDGSYDLSTGVNSILGQFVQNLHAECISFSPTLVDL